MKSRTPLLDALREHQARKIKRYHVPGHKGNVKLLQEELGQDILDLDLNAMADLDDLCSPSGVLQDSQRLMAELFECDDAYYLLNGASGGIQAMILASIDPGQKVLLPRNVHRSVLFGLILSGAIPIFLPVEQHSGAAFLTTVQPETLKKAVDKHPDARAALFVNPNYYGLAADLKECIQLVKKRGMIVLMDEAHGTFPYLTKSREYSGISMGADLSVVSLHKNGGSLTQTAVLLANGSAYKKSQLFESIDMLRSTSSSYLLMLSLELARKHLEDFGESSYVKLRQLSGSFIARMRGEGIDILSDEEMLSQNGICWYDNSRILWRTKSLGITGFEAEKILAKDFNLQPELAMIDHVLFLCGLNDTEQDFQELELAIKGLINKLDAGREKKINSLLPPLPELIVSPRDAFYTEKKESVIEKSIGKIAGEMIMVYPPGIPLICPGEQITLEVIDYLKMLIDENAFIQGLADPDKKTIRILSYS